MQGSIQPWTNLETVSEKWMLLDAASETNRGLSKNATKTWGGVIPDSDRMAPHRGNRVWVTEETKSPRQAKKLKSMTPSTVWVQLDQKVGCITWDNNRDLSGLFCGYNRKQEWDPQSREHRLALYLTTLEWPCPLSKVAYLFGLCFNKSDHLFITLHLASGIGRED